jgi:hypothetical protein
MTFQLLAIALARALRPLTFASRSDDGMRGIVAELGWLIPTVPPSLKALGESLLQLNTSLTDWIVAQSNSDFSENASSDNHSAQLQVAADLALAIAQLHALPGKLRAELPADFVAVTRIDVEFETRLFDWLLAIELDQKAAVPYCLLRVAGIIEVTEREADPARFQPAFTHHQIHWSRLLQIFDPASLARDVYGWGTPELDTVRFFNELVPLSFALGMPGEFRYAPPAFTQRVTPNANPDAEPLPQLWLPVAQTDEHKLFLMLASLARENDNEPQPLALALVPSTAGELTIELDGQLDLTVKASAQIGTGVAMVLRPDRAPDILLDMNGPAGNSLTSGSIAATLRWQAAEGENPDGMSDGETGITARSISFSLGAEVTSNDKDVYGEFALDEGKLIVAPPADDGLLSSVLPEKGLVAPFSLGLRWSKDGLHFRGSAGLTATIPLSLSVGPVRLQALDFALNADEETLAAAAAITASVEIGPVQVTVEQVGLTVKGRAKRGNLGPVDVDITFKPPTGAGLAISAPLVQGGGALRFDPQKGEYSGLLELSIAEKISVKGFALLSTRMPGGGKGFSLIVIIFVEGFAPIQLGFGFALIGIGGLLAINRTFDEEALRSGLKNHTLDSVMFPHDPIRNAPQILSNLSRLFPSAPGRHLFGPMVQLAWGTPPLITAEVAVVLEFGARRRLLIMGQVLSVLPRPEHELVRLQMDAVGVLDFDRGTAALDATLYGSRLIQKFPMTGDMAMRLQWETSPNFALAIGGLHPAFNPPPNFPKLERVAINLSSGDNPRLRCEAYFALTANTVQWGARAELFASAAGFSVHGDIGYDVLIQFSPFSFLAEFHAQLQLKRGSTNLFKVRLEGSLAGPRPLHLKGKATFEIFWWDITFRIDKTLVSGEKPPLPEPIAVLPRLKEALANPGNWVSHLPEAQRPLVQFHAGATTAIADVLLHPLGTLTVKQGVAPLNVEISRFGQGPPAGERRFNISGVSLGEQEQATTPVKDFFAPAQFFEMKDNEKLSRPSFEFMEAGVTFGSAAVTFTGVASDRLEVKTIEFETWIIDETKVDHRSPAELPVQPQAPPLFYPLSRALLFQQARFGAAGSSELRRSGKAKYRSSTIGKYQVTKEGWSIVTDELTEAREGASYSEAVESLRNLQKEDPQRAAGLKILRLSEVKSIA